MANAYVNGLQSAEYLKKLDIVGLDDCPYNIPANSWTASRLKWPELVWPDVYVYLIETSGLYTKESLKDYRSLEAYNYFVTGLVQTVYHVNVAKTTNSVLKADVKSSWTDDDVPVHVWIALKKDGTVISSHCDCVAGLEEHCIHVGAVLLKIEATVRLGYTRPAGAEEPCACSTCSSKSVKPVWAQDIQVYTDVEIQTEKRNQRKRARQRSLSPQSKAEQLRLLSTLAETDARPVALSTYKEFVHLFQDTNGSKFPKSTDT